MDDLYDINFQSDGGFCKIRICYSVIKNWSTIDHLMKWFILEFVFQEGLKGQNLYKS
jgi:hypothetical protein